MCFLCLSAEGPEPSLFDNFKLTGFKKDSTVKKRKEFLYSALEHKDG